MIWVGFATFGRLLLVKFIIVAATIFELLLGGLLLSGGWYFGKYSSRHFSLWT